MPTITASVGAVVIAAPVTAFDRNYFYAKRTDVEIIFGSDNVEKWADLNNNGNPKEINDRILWALQLGAEHVNTRLRGGPYAIPFVEPFPYTIIDLCARYAGVKLYDSRGITDSQQTNHSLAIHLQHVERTLDKLMAVAIRLKTEAASGVTFYPKVVIDA